MHASDGVHCGIRQKCAIIQCSTLSRCAHSSEDTFRAGLQRFGGSICKVGLVTAAGYDDRVAVDPSVVRGLEYYTGPVFEAEITVPVVNDDGQTVRFGSVGGGGRYDGLVERFLGTKVPATGFSIGVSRLAAALAALNKDKPAASDGPVVVLVMEKDRSPITSAWRRRCGKPAFAPRCTSARPA